MVDDRDLVSRLQAGDEAAFATLVDRHHAAMVRLAQGFVPNRAVAEEVVQEAWLGVVRGIDRFEGRSSLKTWLFRIVVNRARTAGARERREAPVDLTAAEPAVAPGRFTSGGQWADPPAAWSDQVDDRLVAAQLAAEVARFLGQIPDAQRQVVVLRDVEGLGSADVCSLLGISEANQRVLLHRGRSRLRGMLERHEGNEPR